MSTLDDPRMIKSLLTKGGDGDPLDFRSGLYSIWQYRTGFGGIAYKVIEGLNGDRLEAIFLATGNFYPGSEQVCLFATESHYDTFIKNGTLGKGAITEAGRRWLEKHESTPFMEAT
jgi:hypothetical protein